MWLDRTFPRLAILWLALWSGRHLAAQERSTAVELRSEERELIAVVERFLTVCGTNDLDSLEVMAAPYASVGYASLHDTTWSTGTLPWKEFIAGLRAKTDPVHYTEPVQKYTIHITEGKMAFVLADATYSPNGKAARHNIDYFTLIKLDGQWEFLSISYVGLPLPGKAAGK
jgi:hypothetical protein